MSPVDSMFPKWLVALAVACALFSQIGIALAESDPTPMEITYDDKLIYCSVGPVGISDEAILALNQGTPVTLIWEITVEEVRKYWLNKSVGEVIIARQAIPDLISKSLIIADAKNGISKRVHSIDEAIAFLSELKRFPILDRSLLTPGLNYNVDIHFHIQEGQFTDTWWSAATRFGTTAGEEELTLP
jgi:hypothetical protein